MPNLKRGGSVNLSIGTGAVSYSKSANPKVSNIFNNVYTISEKDNQFRPIVKFDATGGGLDAGGSEYFGAIDSNSLVIANESEQVIELIYKLSNFDNDDDLIGNNFVGRTLNTILHPSDFVYLPHNVLFTYDHDSAITPTSAGTKSHTASSGQATEFIDPDDATRPDGYTRDGIGLIQTGVLIDKLIGHTATQTELTVDSNYYFKVNDIVQVQGDDTTDELMKIVAIPDATTIQVRRGVLGTTADEISNNVELMLYYRGEVRDSVIKTNSNGKFQANTFFGYGRNTNALPSGLTRGSISIRMREPAYQEFAMTGQTPSTSTGLSTSTSYDFKITNDGDSQQTITLITDSSNVNWGGSGGILSKINNAFLVLYKAGTFTYLPKISIVNGDIRITSGSRLSTSSIVLASGVSNNLFSGSAGRVTALADLISMATKMPENNETKKIIFDDGRGNLSGGQGTGSINYDSGAITLNSFKDAEFEVSAYYNSAISGAMLNSDSDGTGKPTNPRINTILAKSLNPFRDAKVRVIVFDPEVIDPRNATNTDNTNSSTGRR